MVVRNYSTNTMHAPLEISEQTSYFRRVRHLATQDPDFQFIRGSMSGVYTSKQTAGKAKAQGLEPGYPDISWDLPRGVYHGLRIEMKRQNAKSSDVGKDQWRWLEWMAQNGYCAMVCRGCEEAWLYTMSYRDLQEGEEITLVSKLIYPQRHLWA